MVRLSPPFHATVDNLRRSGTRFGLTLVDSLESLVNGRLPHEFEVGDLSLRTPALHGWFRGRDTVSARDVCPTGVVWRIVVALRVHGAAGKPPEHALLLVLALSHGASERCRSRRWHCSAVP